VIKGTHATETGTIKEITKGSAVRAQTVKIDSGSAEFETLADNVMIVGA
jgi:ribosomal protein S4E